VPLLRACPERLRGRGLQQGRILRSVGAAGQEGPTCQGLSRLGRLLSCGRLTSARLSSGAAARRRLARCMLLLCCGAGGSSCCSCAASAGAASSATASDDAARPAAACCASWACVLVPPQTAVGCTASTSLRGCLLTACAAVRRLLKQEPRRHCPAGCICCNFVTGCGWPQIDIGIVPTPRCVARTMPCIASRELVRGTQCDQPGTDCSRLDATCMHAADHQAALVSAGLRRATTVQIAAPRLQHLSGARLNMLLSMVSLAVSHLHLDGSCAADSNTNALRRRPTYNSRLT
jgi:hypothetical protein